jgi:predicted Zn-dependent protease
MTELDPNNPLAHLRYAEARGRARDIDGAVLSFDAAVTLLVEANRRDDALQVLERLLQHKVDPDQARRCAELYLSRARAPHDGMQALTKLQICVQAKPRDVEILGLVARAFHLIGDREKAAAVQMEMARMQSGS